jgi:hypothetical protein
MKTRNILLISGIFITLLAGCASKPVALAPIGPRPGDRIAYVSTGHLRVFSDTKTREIGENSFYYTHTGYTIRDPSGKIVQYVRNHVGSMDETPTLVTIPSGSYLVVAESSRYGRVTVPVKIQDGRTTVVHLDGDWKAASSVSSNEVIRLPDGEAVGWRNSLAKSSE